MPILKNFDQFFLLRICERDSGDKYQEVKWENRPLTPFGRYQASILSNKLIEDIVGYKVKIWIPSIISAEQTAQILSDNLKKSGKFIEIKVEEKNFLNINQKIFSPDNVISSKELEKYIDNKFFQLTEALHYSREKILIILADIDIVFYFPKQKLGLDRLIVKGGEGLYCSQKIIEKFLLYET